MAAVVVVVMMTPKTVGLIGSGTVEGTLYGSSSSTPTSGHPPPARVAATSMVSETTTTGAMDEWPCHSLTSQLAGWLPTWLLFV